MLSSSSSSSSDTPPSICFGGSSTLVTPLEELGELRELQEIQQLGPLPQLPHEFEQPLGTLSLSMGFGADYSVFQQPVFGLNDFDLLQHSPGFIQQMPQPLQHAYYDEQSPQQLSAPSPAMQLYNLQQLTIIQQQQAFWRQWQTQQHAEVFSGK